MRKKIKYSIFFLLFIFTNYGNCQNFNPKSIYDSLNRQNISLPKYEVFSTAIDGYNKLQESNSFSNNILTIIDFDLSSNTKRMWTFNLNLQTLIFNNLVAHGRNSGNEFAKEFSNVPESKKSSLGFYKTGKTYYGKHGYSMYLHGLEKGINGKAKQRSIVMHGAEYVSKSFIQKYGRLGRSYGCPAVPMNIHKEVIDKLKNGSCLFIYHSKNEFREKSVLW